MITDLAQAGQGPVKIEADVAIIGGGVAGLYLACGLARKGIDTVLLEAGSAQSLSAFDMGLECVQTGDEYAGATQGRAFGLGGTSAKWGGQMLPLTPADMTGREGAGGVSWPILYDELVPWYGEVSQVLGLPPRNDETDDTAGRRYPWLHELADETFLRLSQWLPFGKRNLAHLFSQTIRSASRLQVWMNAPVTGFRLQGDTRRAVAGITVGAPGRHVMEVNAGQFVICAGALESTRLLLELDEAEGGFLSRGSVPLGRNFCDHLSMTIGKVSENAGTGRRAFAPVFDSGIMRTPRLELTADAQRHEGLPSAFAHFPFVPGKGTGIDVIRSLLRRRQGEKLVSAPGLGESASAGIDAARLVFDRYVRKRMWWPANGTLRVQLDVEQKPDTANHLFLTDQRDASGRRMLGIDWAVRAADRDALTRSSRKLVEALTAKPLPSGLRFQFHGNDAAETRSLFDVYHPTGCLRMGSSERESVVDADLRLWRLENCYVSSTAVFPTAGGANPGLTHLALTARLADRIARQARKAWQ